MKLLCSALIKVTLGIGLVGTMIFLPAGTFNYLQGWLFMGLLFIPMVIAGFVMLFKAPDLLARRLDAKEKQADQKAVVAVSGLMFVGGFAAAGLDHRFDWSRMPLAVTVISSVLFLAAYGLYAEVLRENAYLSRTIKVDEGQTVISSGLYGIVRHPMYSATIVLFLMMPLVLGSWYAAIIFLVYPALIIIRLQGEEKLLCQELPGYDEYCKKVKYRLIPFIW